MWQLTRLFGWLSMQPHRWTGLLTTSLHPVTELKCTNNPSQKNFRVRVIAVCLEVIALCLGVIALCLGLIALCLGVRFESTHLEQPHTLPVPAGGLCPLEALAACEALPQFIQLPRGLR